jgi:hypothetical protein
MTALVKTDDPQALGQERQDRIPQPQVGAKRIGKDHGRAIIGAIHAVVQADVASIEKLHVRLLYGLI